MQLRKASISEIIHLNQIMRDSKAIWGYTEEFIDTFMDKYSLDKKYLEINYVGVLEYEGIIYGICSFCYDDNEPELNHFYVNAQYIRKGIGTLLWEQVNKYALSQGWSSFKLVAEPYAEPFYKRMGAIKYGTVETFPNRHVPLMKFDVMLN